MIETPTPTPTPSKSPAPAALQRSYKRLLDVVVASAGLVVATPIMAAAAAAVGVGSRGPVLFRQRRIGRDGRPFTLYKFRTMTVDNDDSAHRALVAAELSDPGSGPGTSDGVFKLENDPRVTRVGALLRRTSIDELPQLWNVIRGDMSIVGPRPLIDWEHDLLPPELAAIRSRVRPGLTGRWQVSGRNYLSTLEMLQLDQDYVLDLVDRGVRIDLEILAATPAAVISGGGAR